MRIRRPAIQYPAPVTIGHRRGQPHDDAARRRGQPHDDGARRRDQPHDDAARRRAQPHEDGARRLTEDHGVRRRAPTLSLAAAVAAAVLISGSASAQDVGIDVGTVPTAVTIEDLDGNPVDLAQYVGKRPVLLEFWAEWCEVCKALEPRLRAAANGHAGKADVLVIAVAVNQTKRSILRHLQEHQPPGRILWDTSGRATRAFQAPSTSYVVVLDAKGRVVYTGVGAAQDLGSALDRALAAR